jgi:pimeloyl-ACP methyl ester carboxylesterase
MYLSLRIIYNLVTKMKPITIAPLLTLVIMGLFITSCHTPVSPAISFDGLEINYEAHGEGDLALVFIHGWSCDLTYWREQIPHFSSKYKVVLIDLGGHGDSGQNRERWTMDAFGEDVAAVVKHLGLEKIVLIGHSMGGPVIIEAAQRLPGQVIGLVGADTYGDLTYERTSEQVEEMLKPAIEDFRGTVTPIVKSMFTPDSDSSLSQAIVEDMASAPPSIAIDAARHMYGWKPVQEVPELTIPIATINNAGNQVNEETIAHFGIEPHYIAGVGHFLMMEDPLTFNQKLEGLVQGFVNKSGN